MVRRGSVRRGSARRGSVVLTVATLLAGALPAIAGPAVAAPPSAATSADLPGGTYVRVASARVLDTWIGLGAPAGTTTSTVLTVAGRAGVPATGVGAVVLNVTVTGPTDAGWLAVSPTGAGGTSNLNFVRGQDVAQLSTSKLDDAGRVVLRSSTRTHVVADVVGYFTDSAHAADGATYSPTAPRRLFDSRVAGSGGPLVGGVSRRIALTGVPSGATAVVVDLTGVSPSEQVFVAAWGGGGWPGTSSMNVAAGDIRSNRAIVPVADDGTIAVRVNLGRSDLVVDLSGWFTADDTGSRFLPLDPTRVGDTRGPWSISGPLYRNEDAPLFDTVAVAGRALATPGIPLPPADGLIRPTAAWLSVTVVAPVSEGWLAVAPTHGSPTDPQTPPGTSDVNFRPGVTPNAVLAALGDGGMTSTTSNLGGALGGDPDLDADVVVDIAGVFLRTPQPAPGLWSQGSSDRNDPSWWNHLAGSTGGGRLTEVAAPFDDHVVGLRPDGTVLLWDGGPTAEPRMLVEDGRHVAASDTGIYVVRADGTVWTDDVSAGMHGVPGSVSTFGPVEGLTGVDTVAIGAGGAQAVRTDGSVVAWGGRLFPRVAEVSVRSPVHSVSMMFGGGNRLCASYEDGSFDIRRRDPASPWHVVRSGIGPLALTTAAYGEGCYGLDAAGRIHHLTVDADDTTVTDEILPGITATALASGYAHVQTFATNYLPDVRALTTDGQVWDRTGASAGWTHVPGLDGATAVGGGGSLVTWVPPTP